jgi:YrbI family 3-deoxy-D-manno-octulosonate 8-phosphate phosphatase
MHNLIELKTFVKNDLRMVVFDFDGVFTNNLVYVTETGQEIVCCSRSDGIGLKALKNAGILSIVLSSEENNVVLERCKKLKIECHHGCQDKLSFLKSFIEEKKLNFKNLLFVGNDVNDAECLKTVGFPVVVKDSHSDVIDLGKYVTKKNGGQGAVREICDLLTKI